MTETRISSRSAEALAGLRVLVVEDQAIVALEIEAMLGDLGCVVLGPVGRVAPALRLVQGEALDLAVLDVNLDGDSVEPVAAALLARGVPVIISTGYGRAALPDALRSLPVLEKPFMASRLAALVAQVCAGR